MKTLEFKPHYNRYFSVKNTPDPKRVWEKIKKRFRDTTPAITLRPVLWRRQIHSTFDPVTGEEIPRKGLYYVWVIGEFHANHLVAFWYRTRDSGQDQRKPYIQFLVVPPNDLPVPPEFRDLLETYRSNPCEEQRHV